MGRGSFEHLLTQGFAIGLWYFCNMLVIIPNKWIFEKLHFTFPCTVSALHMVVSTIGALVCIKIFNFSELKKLSKHDYFTKILPVAFVFGFDIILGNVSLRYIPVSFNQTIKAFVPAMTVALKWFVLKKRTHRSVCLTLIPIVGGIVLASVTELSFNMMGFLAVSLACFTTSSKVLLTELLLKGFEFDSMNTLFYMALPSFVMMMGPAIWMEAASVIAWFGAQESLSTPLLIISFSGVSAFCLNFAVFYAIRTTSGVTFTVVGNLKVAIVIFMSWLIFRNPMSFMNVIGCGIAIIGITMFAYVEYKLKENASRREGSDVGEEWQSLPVVNENKINQP